MDYVQFTQSQRQQMLSVVGAASIDDLLKQVPDECRLPRSFDLPPAMDEISCAPSLAD